VFIVRSLFAETLGIASR